MLILTLLIGNSLLMMRALNLSIYIQSFSLGGLLGVLLISALAVCMFMSKTIYNRNLPAVKVILPINRSINSVDDNSNKDGILIPNAAIFNDGSGLCLYQVKKRQGILGNEYYVYALKIQLGESDEL